MVLKFNVMEDFVSYEIGKLLKDKGFDWVCEHYFAFSSYGSSYVETALTPDNWNNEEKFADMVSAPTIQMALKWLRDIHRIFVTGTPMLENLHICYMTSMCYVIGEGQQALCAPKIIKPTYEDACSAGIEYCLNNLVVYKKEEEDAFDAAIRKEFPKNLLSDEECGKALELARKNRLESIKYIMSRRADFGLKSGSIYYDLYIKPEL